MSILAIATSGPNGGLALQSGDAPALHVELAAGRGRGRDVLPALERLLADAGRAVVDIGGITVDIGPGSFTGVRVGVTVAKTLAWSLGIEVRAVNSLDLLAASASVEGEVLAVRDAGRGTVYHRAGDGRVGRSAGAALRAMAADVAIVGEEAGTLAARFGWAGRTTDIRPGAVELLHVGQEAGELVAAHDLAPLYLQASAPERKAAGEVD